MFGLLVAYPAAAATRLPALDVALAIAAAAVFVVGLLTGTAPLLTSSFIVFGAEYAVYLRLRGGPVDSRALLVAAALVLAAELAFDAIGTSPPRAEVRVALRAAVVLAVVVLSAAIVAGVVLVAAGSVASSVALEALGMLAGVIVMGTVVWLAARTRGSTST